MNLIKTYADEMGLSLDGAAVSDFDTLARMLAENNKKFNLTAITDRDEICLKHFADSLAVLAAADFKSGARVVDVGCGAGFPSLPMKIARRDLQMCFLDSTSKKLGFISQVCTELGLENAVTLCGRAEELAHIPEYREGFDFAVARAVARLDVLAECMLPFCRVGGRMLAIKGERAEDELAAAKCRIESCGGRFVEIRKKNIGPIESRIVIIEKVCPTPPQFPRRWAQIVKDV